MEYRILQSRHLATIEKEADNFCKDGYIPNGGIVVQLDPDGGRSFYQVMMLRKTPNTAEDSQNSVQQAHDAIASACEEWQKVGTGKFNIKTFVDVMGNLVKISQQHHA